MHRPAIAYLAVVLLATACASAPAAPEPAVLRVVMADDWATAPVVNEVISDFEREHGHVRVQVEGSPFSQIPAVVSSGIELEQPHDLAHWHAFAAAAADLAEPVDDLWREHGLDTSAYLPGAIADVTWQDRLYGVPLDVNALVLMVNRRHLTEAGVRADDLATVDGFRAATRRVVERSEAKHAITVSASSWVAYGWIVAHGGDLVSGTGETLRFTFDDPATVEALELLTGLVEDERAPPPFAPDLSMDAVATFMSGDVAMYASGSWDLPAMRRIPHADQTPPDVRVLALPQAEPSSPRTVLGGSSLFVPRGARHPELAFDLMLALTERDVSVDLAETEGRLPARKSAYDDPLFASSPELSEFVEQLPAAEVMPLIAYPEVAAAFADGLEEVLAGRRSPARAMHDVQRFAERWLDEG